MVKYFTKPLLILIMCIAAFSAKAQIGYNYDQYDAGLAINGNQVYGDAESSKTTFSASLSLNYNATPFVNYILELQVGSLVGGNSLIDTSGREFKNNYSAIVGRIQVQAGEFIDYSNSQLADVLKNVYLSTGIGVVANNMSYISRRSQILPGFFTPGKDKSTEIFIPIRLGYEYKIFNAYNEPTFKIDLAYQYNMMMDENLDGFDAGLRKDVWGQFTLGVKFAIGGSTSYRKSISRY